MSLITVETLKELCPIQENVESGKLQPAIDRVQETTIYDALGKALYDDVVASPGGSDNAALIATYIKPALAWAAFTDAFYELHYRFSQQGVQVSRGDQYEAVSSGVLKGLQEDYKGKAQYYVNRLIKHLCDDATTSYLPLYLTGDSDDLGKKEIEMTGGMFLE